MEGRSPWRVELLELILLHVSKHLGGKFTSARWIIYLGDDAMLINEQSNTPCLWHAMVVRGAIADGHVHVCVRQKRKLKVVLLSELGICWNGIVAAAKNLNVLGRKVRPQLLKCPSLSSSATGACTWVEPQEEFLTRIVCDREYKYFVLLLTHGHGSFLMDKVGLCDGGHCACL